MAQIGFIVRSAGDRVLAMISGESVASVVTSLMPEFDTVFVDAENFLQEGPQSWKVTCGADFHEARFTALSPEESRVRWARFTSRAA